MNEIAEIGQELVHYAKNEADFSAQRGLVEELFPYIWMASRRMSLRAISQWLESTKGVSLSANTISRAMRNQKKYWLAWSEPMEPAAKVFAEAHDLSADEVLEMEPEHFGIFLGRSPTVCGVQDELNELWELDRATEWLKQWFELPDVVRAECLSYLRVEKKEADAEEGEKK